MTVETNQRSADVDWFRALTLVERRDLLRQAGPAAPADPSTIELAQRRLDCWRSESAFQKDPALFQERLQHDDLCEETFRRLLVSSAADGALLNRSAPPWWAKLVDAYQHSPPSHADNWDRIDGLKLKRSPVRGFLIAVEPLIRRARAHVLEELKPLLAGPRSGAALPLNPATLGDVLLDDLRSRLLVMITRTLVMELNVARLEDRLQGATPEERFNSFVHQLADPAVALALFHEYPVLGRQVIIALDQWSAVTVEWVCHLADDWPLIRATYFPTDDPGVLVKLVAGAGDHHRGGRSVHMATFANGARLVYKPRSLAVDCHFQELLDWANAHDAPVPFRTIRLLDRGTYGWVEFISAAICSTPDEVGRFYQRQGAYLALLYVLRATDFHFENLIAAGEHPVLIDLESLFHPNVAPAQPGRLDAPAIHAMLESVLRIGLLPFRMGADGNAEGAEISGMGGAAGQLTPHPVAAWEDAGTDEMHFVHKRLAMPAERNRPSLNGTDVDPLDYGDEIVSGFSSMYRLLERQRDRLLAKDGPLARFAGDSVRCFLRPTESYGVALTESFHPNLLRNALDRDRLLDFLWMHVDASPALRKVISHERDDLLQGDVPVFTTRPDSRDLWSGSGARIADCFPASGLDLARACVRRLGDEDLKRQVWFIRSALTALTLGADAVIPKRAAIASPTIVARPSPEGYLAAAKAVASRLQALALREQGEVGWIGLTALNDEFWSLAPAGLGLYDGLTGIGLFLLYLGAVTREESHRSFALEIVHTVERHLDDLLTDDKVLLGAFGPVGGTIYFLSHAGVVLGRPDLLERAEELAISPRGSIAQDNHLDIIAGTAGFLASLVVLHHCRPSARIVEAAIACGDHLLATAEPLPHGIGWPAPFASDGLLTGFSHGAAGISWTLAELATLTGESRFRHAAARGLAYERSLFNADAGNWPDLRRWRGERDAGNSHLSNAWCHGAPGIGLSRLLIRGHLQDDQIDAEIDAAVRSTLAKGFGTNHSLCHGDLGNLDFLALAAKDANDPSLAAQVDQLAAKILASMARDGWICGSPQGVETPGLMVGLAGLGYGCLRLAVPTLVPSVLALAPPVGLSRRAPGP